MHNELLYKGALWETLEKILSDTVLEYTNFDTTKKDAINQHYLSTLAGEEIDISTILPAPSMKGNFVYRLLSIHKNLEIQTEYKDVLNNIITNHEFNASYLLSRNISHYIQDLFIFNERLKKLIYDSSFLLKPNFSKSVLWVGDDRNGKPSEMFSLALRPFKVIRDIRNNHVHDWDFESKEIMRLSALEIWLKIDNNMIHKGNLILTEYESLLHDETQKWLRLIDRNLLSSLSISNEVVRLIEPKIDLQQM